MITSEAKKLAAVRAQERNEQEEEKGFAIRTRVCPHCAVDLKHTWLIYAPAALLECRSCKKSWFDLVGSPS